jgi:MFS transporter, NNP family, nitrate/nitrite transporter
VVWLLLRVPVHDAGHHGDPLSLWPQRFAAGMTGIVGAAGGLGGFFLRSVLGAAKDATGTYAIGLVAFAAAFMAGSFVLLELGTRWTVRWQSQAVKRSGIFCDRRAVASGFSRTSA